MKTILLSLLLVNTLLFGQTKAILKPSGEIKYDQEIQPLNTKTLLDNIKPVQPYDNVFGLVGLTDTLRHWPEGPDWNTGFGFSGQDVMVQWFIAPADMDIVSISFTSSDDEGSNVSVKLVEMNWTAEQLLESGIKNWGYYQAAGNGFNDIEPFIENDHDFFVGDWIDVEGSGGESPFGEDIWSDDGHGVPVTVNLDSTDKYWVPMNELGFSPSIMQGIVFGVVIKNDSPNLDQDRHDLVATTSGAGVPGFKFYANGRFTVGDGTPDPDNWGWWTREYSWDIEVIVSLGDCRPPRPISIQNPVLAVYELPHTVIARYYGDDNPNGSYRDSVYLSFKTATDTSWTLVLMDSIDVHLFSYELPLFENEIEYFCETKYNNPPPPCGNSQSQVHSLKLFKPMQQTLLIFNGYTSSSGYPQSYYFGIDDSTFDVLQFPHDRWSYGPLQKKLLDNYDNLLEITTSGPNDSNDVVIREWLEADGARNYMLVGDEYLGKISGWPGVPVNYAPGTFQRDILGIKVEHSDIVESEVQGTHVRPVAGSLLGNPMYQYAVDLGISIDSIYYDPSYEISVSNWLDGVEITEDSESFMQADSGDTVLSVGHSRILPAGNKIAFFAFDPLSIHVGKNHDPVIYKWLSFDESSPQVQVLKWFGIVTNINDKPITRPPEKFRLQQNYPNPFNNSTIINYQLSMNNDVKLLVYDALGREVQTLVNKEQSPGTYQVTFDAENLSSGVYYYKLVVGETFKKTKKMLLLK